MRPFSVAAVLAAFSVSASAATLHEYSSLALSPVGDRVAAIESDAVADSTTRAHGHIVVRSATTGQPIATIDPCADCTYSGLTFGPDGRLAFIASSKGSARLMLAGAGVPVTLATIDGIAEEPRFSPDGRRIALLVTI